ncbi:Wsp signal transduction system chemoreceptor WspA [soil metagenome]
MTRLTDFSLRVKLYGLVLFGTLVLAGVVGLSAWLLMEFRVNGPVYLKLARQRELLDELRLPTLVLAQPFLTLNQIASAEDEQASGQLQSRFQRQQQAYLDAHERWARELPEGPLRQEILIRAHIPAMEVLRLAREEFLPQVGKGNADALRKILDRKISPTFEEHFRIIGSAIENLRVQLAESENVAAQRIRFWLIALTVLSIVSIITMITAGIVLTRGIVLSTLVLLNRVTQMAEGASDLTARIPVDSKDEIGRLAQAINGLIGKVQNMVQRIRESSLQLSSTASEIAANAQQQEQSMRQLDDSTAQIAAAVHEISGNSRELSTTTSQISTQSNQTSQLASSGQERLALMQTNLQQLVESTASISNKLALIREKANNINQVVITITKVADQTNLLSINAAIEAEKAGEFGRGFMVVAREVSRLADQTAMATTDIDAMVRQMHDAVSAGVMQMDKFTDEVRTGVANVSEVNQQTDQIIDEVRNLGAHFQSLDEGMRQQALGAEHISQAILQVSASTKQSAAALAEFNAATRHLRSSVDMLNQEIAGFTV